jgi:hypothetical protein
MKCEQLRREEEMMLEDVLHALLAHRQRWHRIIFGFKCHLYDIFTSQRAAA